MTITEKMLEMQKIKSLSPPFLVFQEGNTSQAWYHHKQPLFTWRRDPALQIKTTFECGKRQRVSLKITALTCMHPTKTSYLNTNLQEKKCSTTNPTNLSLPVCHHTTSLKGCIPEVPRGCMQVIQVMKTLTIPDHSLCLAEYNYTW